MPPNNLNVFDKDIERLTATRTFMQIKY